MHLIVFEFIRQVTGMLWKGVGSVIALCALVLLAGAATAAPADTATAAPADADAPPPPAIPVSPDYRVGPGDALHVFVWRNPELSVTVPVRPDGKISTPLVEDMVAVGKTSSQLAKDIEAVLAEYVRSPKVNIIVTQPVSAFSQVKVVGQVGRPQSLAYRDGMTVMDAMLAVGGLGQFAAGNRARIVRSESGKQTELRVRLVDLLNKGDLKQNVPLQPGDVLIVPQAMF